MTSRLLVTALLLAACSGKPEAAGAALGPAEAEAAWVDICSFEERCDEGELDCVEDCVAGAPNFRGDIMVAVAECALDLACGVEVEVCLERIEPSAAYDRYRDGCEARGSECGRTICESSADQYLRMFTDALMAEVIACQDLPCAEIRPCVADILEEHGLGGDD